MRLWPVIMIAMTLAAGAGHAVNPLDGAARDQVLKAVIEHLEADYVDPESGSRAARQLRADQAAGRFQHLDDGESFAAALSTRLQALTDDGHLNVEYSRQPISAESDNDQDYNEAQMQRWYGAQINYGVNRVERLEDNLGYFDLRVFPPLAMGGETIAAAMTVLADMDGLVIDLRENGGGIGDTADLISNYLFDAGRQPLTGVYDRPSDTLTQRYTLPYVPGKRFGASKPVYVLISSKTFSAAEALTYNLQALGRATIIGEVSGGGAHPFEYLPVHQHFVLWSVTARSVNPITGSNWQSTGVKPDIAVPAADALRVAQDAFRARGSERKPGPD